ncbi:MAG: hypothetical protein KF770_32755 [Anaerolineae bacterium]|nr:hypothetical protein [Anaerolineae bacterium]
MTDKHPPEIYGTAVTAPLYSPCRLHIDPMERLLLINFENDPDEIYKGFEPQVFADAVHGQGMLVIGWRVDGRVDVYHQPGLTLDPKTYDIAGDGLAEMVARPFTDAHFMVNKTGVDAAFAFLDVAGRPVEVTIREQNRRKRKPFGLLAPMGSAATAPSALPLVYLHDFYFVRRAGTAVAIMVAGQMRRPDVLPLPLDGARIYFTRYSPEPLIATLNPAHNGRLLPLERISASKAQAGDLLFDLSDNHGWTEIARMRRVYKGREVIVAFMPSLPNLAGLSDGAQTGGGFTITADPTVGTVSGTYQVARQGGRVQLTMTPGNGWQPNENKWMLRFLYRVAPIFREWPKTYRRTAVLDLTDPQQATMQSAWQRMI